MTVEELDDNIRKVEEKLRELQRELAEAKNQKEKTYRVGMKFSRSREGLGNWHNGVREKWLFAQATHGMVVLVSTETGNRWLDAQTGNAFNVAQKEFIDLFGEGWEEVV